MPIFQSERTQKDASFNDLTHQRHRSAGYDLKSHNKFSAITRKVIADFSVSVFFKSG